MKGSQAEKRLASQFIARFFKFFPKLQENAIDAMLDLCEDEDNMVNECDCKILDNTWSLHNTIWTISFAVKAFYHAIGFPKFTKVRFLTTVYHILTAVCFWCHQIRRQAIKGLPDLCKDTPEHLPRIADVLTQLLQSGMVFILWKTSRNQSCFCFMKYSSCD